MKVLFIDWITWKRLPGPLERNCQGAAGPEAFAKRLACLLVAPEEPGPAGGSWARILCQWSGSYAALAGMNFCVCLFFFSPHIGGSHDKKWNLSSGHCIYWARTSLFGPVFQQFHWWIHCSVDSIGKRFVLSFSFGVYFTEWIENCPCHSALPFLTGSDFSCQCGGSARVPRKPVFWELTGFLPLAQRCESKFTALPCNYALVQVDCLRLFC